MESDEPKDVKGPKKRKNKKGRERKEGREPRKIPSDATVNSLAKAMWSEIKLRSPGTEGKVASEQRAQLWKADKKEYLKIARKVINRLGRRTKKGEGTGKKGERRARKAGAADTEE